MPQVPTTILLVEDDDGDALLVEDLLEEAGLDGRLARARTIAEALPALAAGPACVLLDLGLPDAMGLDALERVRDAAPDTAVLVLTGLDDTQRAIDAVAAGAQDYLVKGRVGPDELARAISYAVERKRVEASHRELRAAKLMADENARLQRGLLPRPLVFDPELEVVSGYRPGQRRALLGGDFYDVVQVADGTVHAMVGDVCGHGPDEAALGVCLRIAWRTLVLGGREPDDLFATLQELLVHERHTDDLFATACMVSVAPDRRSATLRLAGHPPPLLLSGDGVASLPGGGSRPPLGVLPSMLWPSVEVALGADPWRLLLYTDGLIEGRVGDGTERLGAHRLAEIVRDAASAVAEDGLLEHLIGTAEALNG
ncbi:MAG: SpoIIE family protein phosphatase, partial [Solirubrobacterales bacterium]|nr:SpoIIE family protein phosphatase [Solirubrobacterales bacterium]